MLWKFEAHDGDRLFEAATLRGAKGTASRQAPGCAGALYVYDSTAEGGVWRHVSSKAGHHDFAGRRGIWLDEPRGEVALMLAKIANHEKDFSQILDK